jgi:preprotein translocase subunit SecD
VSRLRARAFTVAAVMALMLWLSAMNFVPAARRAESPWLPDTAMRLGLDLQGGIHWVLGAKLDVAVEHELDYVRNGIRAAAEEGGFAIVSADVSDGRVVVTPKSPDEVAKLRAWADERGGLLVLSEAPERVELGLAESWKREVRERGMSQVLEVLRRRIDDPVTGIPESVVTRQGDDRILVQIPGGQIERSRARELLRVTGFLEFKIVQDQDRTEELLLARHGGSVPEGMELVFEKEEGSDRVLNAYLVRQEADITGDYLTDARVVFDNMQRPQVSFQFNDEGGRIFGNVTAANIGKPLAIVLDERVYSAPSIRTQITMRGQIEGRFSPEEAADLAVVLRAGSLPVPVAIEEERLVGPALGADSIASGIRASVVVVVFVALFAAGYYRLSGLYAGLSLLANLVLIVGVMSLFEATLTLPGLAGMVLTVATAIDGNILIFERIREELRNGKTPRAAIATGFSKVFWTIMDANVTTLITALVLYEYGTGPIKGFAVTTSIGLVTSVFSALVVTRLLFALYPGERPVESVSI